MFSTETAAPDVTRMPEYDDEDSASKRSKRQDFGVMHESFSVQYTDQVTGAVFSPTCVPVDAIYYEHPCGITVHPVS